MKKRATLIDFVDTHSPKKIRLCADCGYWTTLGIRAHETLCNALQQHSAALRAGLTLIAAGRDGGVRESIRRVSVLAPWPRAGSHGRVDRDGYERRSSRAQFRSVALYTKERPPSRCGVEYDENGAFVARLREHGYSDGEIALALWRMHE